MSQDSKATFTLRYDLSGNVEVNFRFDSEKNELELLVYCGHTDARQTFEPTQQIDWHYYYGTIVEMIRLISKEEQLRVPMPPMRGIKAGNADFEVFITPSFQGEHVVQLWVLDEYSNLHIPFTGKARTTELSEFADQLEVILGS